MSDLIVSYIRTGVPVLIGTVVAWLLTLGIELDSDTQAALITGLTGALIAVYYAVARWIESRWPSVGGFLLGRRAEPHYDGRRIRED